MPVSGETYKRIGRATAGAVAVVLAFERGTIVGLTVSSFVTLSFDPPLVMFAIQNDANSYSGLVSSKAFGVSVLAADQTEIARRFATKGGDKIVNSRHEVGIRLGAPLIPDSLAQIECLTKEIFVTGDHAIVVGLVEEARTRQGEPLLYFERRFGAFVALAPAS